MFFYLPRQGESDRLEVPKQFSGRAVASCALKPRCEVPIRRSAGCGQIGTSQRGLRAQQAIARPLNCLGTLSRSNSPCRGSYKNTGQTSSVLYQFCLRMGTEPVPETYLNQLTRLIAREDYIESCRRESFKTYISFHFSNHHQLLFQ